MGLEEYDLYAIKNYSFTVKKTNSFFSLPTVVLSLLIVGLSLLINLNTLSNLWLPFESLDAVTSTALEIPEPLTSTLLCLKPSSAANINRFSFYSSTLKPIAFSLLSEEEVAASYPGMKQEIGSGFACVDLEGLAFANSQDRIYIEAQDPNVTLYVKGTSL
jgi:hypothetical protein